MKIAVASQNRKQITDHTGHCQRFWMYEIEEDQIRSKELLELSKEQSFHESSSHDPHPLRGIQVLIGGNMGYGLVRRLRRMGIEGVVTPETDPDAAIAAYLAGSLSMGNPDTIQRHKVGSTHASEPRHEQIQTHHFEPRPSHSQELSHSSSCEYATNC